MSIFFAILKSSLSFSLLLNVEHIIYFIRGGLNIQVKNLNFDTDAQLKGFQAEKCSMKKYMVKFNICIGSIF